MVRTIRVDGMGKRGPLPKKRKKVLDWVRHNIATGVLKPGDRLPDRKWFREKFDIANYPVQLSFDELIADGLVKTVSGHGTTVVENLPFRNRYLLLVGARHEDASVNLFAPALRVAAQKAAARRGATFDILELADEKEPSVAYAQMMEDVRHLRYAGVFVQTVTEEGHGLDVVTNVDDVPMAYFARRSELTQGRLAKQIKIYGMEWVEQLYARHFESCREKGCRSVAVFCPLIDEYNDPKPIRRLAEKNGLELVENGYHQFNMRYWNPCQFRRLLDLFLKSDAGRAADAVVLGDDNMLETFAERCRNVYGAKAESRYFVSCHCNFPCPPRSDFPAVFHGPDLEHSFDTFMNYAEDCLAGVRKPRLPEVVVL